MTQNTDTLPKAGQHVIATRGTSRLEGIVGAPSAQFPLVTLTLLDGTVTTEFDLWATDGWTYEVVTEGVLA